MNRPIRFTTYFIQSLVMMQPFPPTLILRHRKENLKKCSLRGIEHLPNFKFFTYPRDSLPEFSNYIILKLGAPVLTEADKDRGLFILDGTWRYAEKMLKQVEGKISFEFRSLPDEIKTAYPRRQEDCVDPEKGLSSIEAIFIAYTILGRETEGLLDHYYWKNNFIEKNKLFLDFYRSKKVL